MAGYALDRGVDFFQRFPALGTQGEFSKHPPIFLAPRVTPMARIIDWITILQENRVSYVTSGPNVSRGELGIRCPFCGSADPSHHMGLNLETGWWSCWRNRAQHSGKSPIRLLMRLLAVPYNRAREVAGLSNDYVDPEGFDAMAARLLRSDPDMRPEQVQRRFLQTPKEMVRITSDMRTRKAWNYLYSRKFDGQNRRTGEYDVDLLCDLYGLMTARTGLWKDRVIIPYYQDGELVTWSGRAIGPAEARYKTLNFDEALLSPKQTLFNYDCLVYGGEILVLVEGPIDALKIDLYGRALGVRAVALSTSTLSEDQTFAFQEAVGKFARILVMMDNASGLGLVDSYRVAQGLSFLDNVTATPVPFKSKDAGALSPSQVLTWAESLLTLKGDQ